MIKNQIQYAGLCARRIAVMALSMAAWPAAAQQQQQTIVLDTIVLHTQTAPLNLSRDSTAGSRVGLTIRDTPASVEVIDGQTIRARGQTDVNQAIVQNGTGLSYHGSPGNGGTALSMRGFAGHGSITRLYDGTRLYPASGTITFPADTWNVDRIEVLHGPAAVLYGEGSVGGAVNIVPKKPRFDATRTEAQFLAGTDGLLGYGVSRAGPLGDRLAYHLDISRRQSDGWVDGGRTSSRAVTAGLAWQATDTLTVSLTHDFAMTRPMAYFGTPLINGDLDSRIRRNNYNIEDSLVRFRDNFTQLRAEWAINPNVTLSSTLYALRSDRDWRNVESYAASGGDVLLRHSYIAINHNHQQTGTRTELTINAAPQGMETTTVVGFDLNRIRFRNTNNSPYSGESTVSLWNPVRGGFGPYHLATTADLTTQQSSLFVDHRTKVTGNLSLVGGLRYDKLRVSRVTPSFTHDLASTNWRIGAVYDVTPDVTVYAQYSRAAEPIGNILSMAPAQTRFKPTRARQAEIGIKGQFWDGRAEATLSAYQIVKRDMLTRDPNDRTVIHQIGQQSSKGIEAAIGVDLTPTLRVDANAAFLTPRYDDYVQAAADYSGHQPPNAPRRVANIWASWDVAQDWTLRGGLHHVGRVYTSDANTMTRPSYTTVNAGASWRPRADISLDLTLNNLTNKTYATSGGASQWMLAPPRNASLALNLAF
ncbi:TonB-dependent siderophore receptor [Paracoccus sp. (in: a-proteobacteria)]|uniref:TonB-dependent receptor n=1 Tax=Paracoccus sp. TaxID=267 RepID=UPI0026DEC474|nr:TonB-dependent siderophore receptor [Paracoccus sp. (in: a-proteobacteria)]MDO5647157.1 TonB-dependent siderophore receptor [Paracoccus sp. (in: a-proteobacteria)]